MELSQEHKDAIARGRVEARAIRAYLGAIANRRSGRPVSQESLSKRLTRVVGQLETADDPLQAVDLIQAKLDIEKALSDMSTAVDLEALEAAFVEHAESYGRRKGISYTAWREFGVPAKVLRAAGVKETRRR